MRSPPRTPGRGKTDGLWSPQRATGRGKTDGLWSPQRASKSPQRASKSPQRATGLLVLFLVVSSMGEGAGR
jgi:hypothetical protein